MSSDAAPISLFKRFDRRIDRIYQRMRLASQQRLADIGSDMQVAQRYFERLVQHRVEKREQAHDEKLRAAPPQARTPGTPGDRLAHPGANHGAGQERTRFVGGQSAKSHDGGPAANLLRA